MTYMYEPVDSTKSEIRLLRFSVDQSGVIHGALIKTSLKSNPRFTSLSYVWGDSSVNDTLLIGRTSIGLTANLSFALRNITKHWQHEFPTRSKDSFFLWADAICINQTDIAEKGQQVSLMAQVYTSAELVVSWLGTCDKMVNISFDSMEFIDNLTSHLTEHELTNLGWIRDNPSLQYNSWELANYDIFPKNKLWYSIFHLFEQEHWARVWILQETCLARRLVMCTATKSLSYSVAERVFQKLFFLGKMINERHIARPDFMPASSTVWRHLTNTYFGGHSRINMIAYARAHMARAVTGSQCQADGALLSLLGRALHATNPKDHVYGLLSLSHLQILPDYSEEKSLGDVYRDYVEALIAALYPTTGPYKTPPLFFLYYSGTGLYGDQENFPSWAPNFPKESRMQISGDMNDMPNLCADKDSFSPQDEPPRVLKPNLLVSGVILEAIFAIQHLLPEPSHDDWRKSTLDFIKRVSGPHAKTWWESCICIITGKLIGRDSAAKTQKGEITPLQTFVRTWKFDSGDVVDESLVTYAFHLLELLVCDGHRPTVNEHLADLGLSSLKRARDMTAEDRADFDSSFVRVFFPGYTGTIHAAGDEFMGQDGPRRTATQLSVLEDEGRLRSRWRFFETQSGHIGLGPVLAKPGDLVCILHGSSWPVVLRRMGKVFTHVGVCFELGLMKGETSGRIKSGELRVEMLEIR